MTYVYENRRTGERREVEMSISLSGEAQRATEDALLGVGDWHRVPQLATVHWGSHKSEVMYNPGRDDDRQILREMETVVHEHQTRVAGKPNDCRRDDWQEAHAPPERTLGTASQKAIDILRESNP